MHRSVYGKVFLVLALSPLVCCQELLLLGDGNRSQGSDQVPQAKVESSPLDTLQNVTGTFKGTWKQTADGAQSKVRGLRKGAGNLFLKLSDVRERNATLHTIQGEAVLRAGFQDDGEEDIVLMVEGVYVEETATIHALASTGDPAMTQQVQTKEYEQQVPAYRRALYELTGKYLMFSDLVRKGGMIPGGAVLTGDGNLLMADHVTLRKRCQLTLNLKASLPNISDASSTEAQEAQRQPYILLNGTASSTECGIHLVLGAKSTHLDLFISKAIKYTVCITSLTFLQIWLLTRQASASNTQAQMSNMSMLMMGQQAVADAVLCLAHLSTGVMVEPVFNAFATSAFLEFILFAVFEMRLILNIWRARRSPDMDIRTQQRELLALYIKFYLALLASIFLAYKLQRFMEVIIFAAFTFWVPQIVACVSRDCRPPLKPLYLWGTSVCRLLLPLYFFLCPHNLLRLKPSPVFFSFLCCWMTIQVLVILGQAKFGPRFFIPKRFLPAKYDYFRSLTPQQIAESPRAGQSDVETGDGGHECVICMNPIDLNTNSARMITPCNHYFHPACLQRWMIVKMECPTCRSMLPPE